jgi:membrane protein YdbS with pleckstrin-like domain
VTDPEPAPVAPLTSWQRAELCALLLVIAVQLWLYRVSVVAAAAWGLLVPAFLIHVYFWMAPLVRQQHSQGGSDRHDLP